MDKPNKPIKLRPSICLLIFAAIFFSLAFIMRFQFQNKYRSALKSHRDLVDEIAASLKSRGVKCGAYAKSDPDNFTRLTEYIAALDESRVGKFLSLIEKLT